MESKDPQRRNGVGRFNDGSEGSVGVLDATAEGLGNLSTALPFAFANSNFAQDDRFIESSGGDEVDFQVNGETYFLSLAEDERRWLVFVSTEGGARPVPVYEDAPEFQNFAVVADDKKKHRIPN